MTWKGIAHPPSLARSCLSWIEPHPLRYTPADARARSIMFCSGADGLNTRRTRVIGASSLGLALLIRQYATLSRCRIRLSGLFADIEKVLRAELLDMALAGAGRGRLWRAGLCGKPACSGERACPALGREAALKPGRRVLTDVLWWIDWGRCAAQRGASPLATTSSLATQWLSASCCGPYRPAHGLAL